MMETADARERNHPRSVAWIVFSGTPIGSVLAEPIVRAVLMVIANVVPKQSSQVLFVQRNHMVQQLPAAASDPSFSHSVLPGRFAARPFGLQSMERRVFRTSASNLVSRSRIAYWYGVESGKASRN